MEEILKDLERTKELLDVINKITNTFVSKPDDSGFNLVLDHIVKFMKSEYGVLGYLSKDKEYLTAAVSGSVWDICGVAESGKVLFNKHEWKGVWAEVIYRGKSQIVNNGNFTLPNGHVNLKNVIGVPIKRADEVIGYFLISSNEHEYTEDDLSLLRWISSWLSPIIYTRLKELELKLKMEKIQLSILEMLNYANMYVLILDEEMKIKFINFSLATEIGFNDEIEPLGRCWLDFIPTDDHTMVSHIHGVISTSDDYEKYKEISSDVLKKDGSIFPVKWFNMRINHIYNWTFSFGLTKNKAVEITEESVRAYWEDRVLRDTTMIQSMRELLTSNNPKIKNNVCVPDLEQK
jgi:PAS domain-containing protein